MTSDKVLPVVEQFYTIQGEGYHTGKAAYFLRLGGCDVGCNWCDSRYSWNPEHHPPLKVDDVVAVIKDSGADSVVITGGEPLMWNLDYLCESLKKADLKTFLETSGAYPLSGVWDWICLSPKKNKPPQKEIEVLAHELKIVVESIPDFEWAEKYRLRVNPDCKLFLQPEWSKYETIVPEIVAYVKTHCEWNISLQVHKFMHIP